MNTKTVQILSICGAALFEGKPDEKLREVIVRAVAGGADLSEADLRGAYLSGANLSGANLSEADLRWAKINWSSHDLVAEILRREAGGDIAKLKIAGLFLVTRDLCWPDYLALDDACKAWALDTLSGYVVDGDDAPAVLRNQRG